MSEEVKVEIFESDDAEDELPSNGLELIKWIESKIDAAPKEHQEKVVVDIEGIERWDYGYITVCIYYYRPETKEEKKERKSRYEQAQRVSMNNIN